MRKSLFIALAMLAVALFACKKEPNTPSNSGDYVKGKNRYTITVEGVEREYYVHVPQGYTGTETLPLVFMLHGTSGNGLDMWDRSGWKEVGDTANILTVYPSSLRFCIDDPNDGIKTTTKWNSQPSEWTYCNPAADAKDDIAFLKAVLAEVSNTFKVNSKKVYLVGFSNGGQMAAKCSIFMSDKLAAVCSNAASFSNDTTYSPLRKIPTLFQLGNKDYGPGVDGPEISLSIIDEVLANTAFKPHQATNTYIKSFGLSGNYTLSGDTSTAMIATYPSLTAGSTADYRFVFVKGLAHAYPNGTNHWMKAAPLHWNWLKQFSL